MNKRKTILYFAVLFITAFFENVTTKVFDPCDLAKQMIEKYKFPKADIADCKQHT